MIEHMNEKERWVEFRHNPNYQISSMGRFKSKDRVVNYQDGRKTLHKGKEITPYLNNDGYFYVRTKENGKVRRYSLHRSVAEHFIEPQTHADSLVVDHINGDRLDNRATNLQYISRSENIIKAIYVDDNNRSPTKLCFEKAEEIRELFKKGWSISDLARKFNVAWPSIKSVIEYKNYHPKNYRSEWAHKYDL